MKTLYLHVGTPKTATSAIQRFLFENKELLERQGFSFRKYPPHRYRGVVNFRNGHFLIGKVYDEDGNEDEQKRIEVWEDVTARILKQFEKYDNVILSDESLWLNFAKKTDTALPGLKNWTDAQGIGIKVIVYLRRQDDFVSSLWHQQVKEGTKTCSFQDYIATKEVQMRDSYYTNLSRIAELIGKENIIVRRFDRSCFVGGSIQADFLDALGLEKTDEYSMKQEFVNFSTNNNYTEILRILNVLSDESGVIMNTENQYFADIALRLSVREGESSALFDEESQNLFLKKHLTGNRKVAEEYLGIEGDLFDYKPSELPLWSGDSQEYREAVLKYFGQALLDQKIRLDEFKAEKEAFQKYIRELPVWEDGEQKSPEEITKFFGEAFAEQKVRLDRMEAANKELAKKLERERRELEKWLEGERKELEKSQKDLEKRLSEMEAVVDRLNEQMELKMNRLFRGKRKK